MGPRPGMGTVILYFILRLGADKNKMYVQTFRTDFCSNASKRERGTKQGWEFAHYISERIARFLPKNERMSDSL